MNPTILRSLALAAGLALLPALAGAVPVITGASSAKTTANTGATMRVYCTDCGYSTDKVTFPGGAQVTPSGVSLNSYVDVRVPATWSGSLTLQKQGAGAQSNAWPHDISYNWSGDKWFTLPFTWYLNSAGAPGVAFNDARDALINGYDAWSCASGASATYGGTTGLAVTAQDGTNCRYWSNSGWGSGTIAVTTWWYWTATGEIFEADIGFNAQHFTWSTSGLATAMDIQNIGTHEEGHSIGLLDMYGTNDAEKTMYGFGSNGETQKRTLHNDDVLGAEFMYPHTRANMTFATPAGWSGSIVPRTTNDATGAYAPYPASLPGNVASYVNVAETNNGGDCASPGATDHLLLDGDLAYSLFWGGVWGAGATYGLWQNLGVNVRGGRHTWTHEVDVNAEVVESNEGDNTQNGQFVYSPLTLGDQVATTRGVPPDEGTLPFRNCDGVQGTGHWWGCLAVLPTASNDDYDIRLYGDYTGGLGGFVTPLASSAWGSGWSDFVLWNGNVVGLNVTRQAGIERYAAGSGAAMRVNQSNEIGSTLVPGTAYASTVSTPTISMGTTQIVKVHEVYLGSTTTTYSFHLDNLSGGADLDFGLYPATGDYMAKSSYLVSRQTAAPGGDESFDYQPSATGYYAVVVWKRGYADASLANTYALSVGPALSNLNAEYVPAGWTASNVARSTAWTSGPLTVSPTLPGDTGAYLYYEHRFEGPTPAPGYTVDFLFDDQVISGGNVPSPTTPVTQTWVLSPGSGVITIPGGRHTLGQVADPLDVVAESDEVDNRSADQYVWTPNPASSGAPLVHTAPPSRGGGLQPNSNARRYSPPAGYAWVTSLANRTTGDDYDLYVYDDFTSSTSGLSNVRSASAYSGDATDFVVGAYNSTPGSWYPAAVRWSVAGGAAPYALDQEDSQGRVANVAGGTWVDQALASNRLADVYELSMTAGQKASIVLHRSSGADDLAFSLYPSTAGGVYRRSEAIGFSIAFGSATDTLEFTAPSTGYFPLVVYRTDGLQSSEALTYRLGWNSTRVLDAPGGGGALALAFTGPVPNPVRANARLTFDLPRQAGVKLDVFDLSGRVVRTLADRTFEPGRHDVALDRQALQPGLYWARLQVAGEAKPLTRRFTVLGN